MKDNNDISQDLIETIEHYINGTLSSQELNDFNQLLELDNDFKIKVDDIKTMLLGIETQSLKEQLDDFHKDVPNHIIGKPNNNKVRFLNYSRIAVAAAIIIAVGSIWFFSTPQNEKLYAKYFKPDPGLPTTMSSTNNYDFYDAMVKYKYGDYNIAIEKWETLLERRPESDTLNYFLGVAYLANQNPDNSIKYLNKVIELPVINFKNEAYYYLGLAYLKVDNEELSKKNLKLTTIGNGKQILLELTD